MFNFIGLVKMTEVLADNNDKPVANKDIKAEKVSLIDANDKNLGIVSINEALDLANKEGLDLVEIKPDDVNPVCKIMSLDKYSEEMQKRKTEAQINDVKVFSRRFIILFILLQTIWTGFIGDFTSFICLFGPICLIIFYFKFFHKRKLS